MTEKELFYKEQISVWERQENNRKHFVTGLSSGFFLSSGLLSFGMSKIGTLGSFYGLSAFSVSLIFIVYMYYKGTNYIYDRYPQKIT